VLTIAPAETLEECVLPVYEYACTECGEQLEVRQSFTDAALTVCPVCSGRLRKVLSPVGVVFKGSGFYRTDSRAAESSSNGGDPGADGKGSGDKAGKDGDKPAKESKDGKEAKIGKDAKGDSAAGTSGSGSGSGSGKDGAGSSKPSDSSKSSSTAKASTR
jgi:putative FmdB family regulatory protein